MGSREIRILNYEFSFCLFFFCRCEYSFVQRQEFCLSGSIWLLYLRPQVIDLRLWRLLPFRQRLAGELKTSTVMDISVFESVFGLKSRIFITAEFILRHESSSETCLEGRTFICHEGAKMRSWLRPQNIITPALPDGSACPLILRGQVLPPGSTGVMIFWGRSQLRVFAPSWQIKVLQLHRWISAPAKKTSKTKIRNLKFLFLYFPFLYFL